jgi:hypothetical protein
MISNDILVFNRRIDGLFRDLRNPRQGPNCVGAKVSHFARSAVWIEPPLLQACEPIADFKQFSDPAAAHSRFAGNDVLSGKFANRVATCIQLGDFVRWDGERRPRRLGLRVLQGDEQGLSAGRREFRQVLDVGRPQLGSPRYQCCPVEHGGNIPELGRREGEVIAAEEFEVRRLVDIEVLRGAAPRGNAVFHAKGLQRNGRQFDPDHGVAVVAEPQEVHAFAAQRDEYPAPLG